MRIEATGDVSQRLCSRQTILNGCGMLLVRCTSTMHIHGTLVSFAKTRAKAVQMLLLLTMNAAHTPLLCKLASQDGLHYQ